MMYWVLVSIVLVVSVCSMKVFSRVWNGWLCLSVWKFDMY